MKVKEALNVILEQFESGDIPEAVALTCYPPVDIPIAKWSLLNKLWPISAVHRMRVASGSGTR